MIKKITWKVVQEDFKNHYPRMHKKVIYWRPYNFATIVLYFKDGRMGTYNYDEKKLAFLKETWLYEMKGE